MELRYQTERDRKHLIRLFIYNALGVRMTLDLCQRVRANKLAGCPFGTAAPHVSGHGDAEVPKMGWKRCIHTPTASPLPLLASICDESAMERLRASYGRWLIP